MISPELDTGIGAYVESVCAILDKNHDVTLLTSSKAIRQIQCSKTIRLDSWKFPLTYYYMPKLKPLLKDGFFEKFDIIQINGFASFAADYLMFNKNKIKTPIVFTPHGGLPHPNISLMRAIHDKIILRFDWNKFDRFIAVSFEEKNRLCRLGFDEKKIDVIYNGGGNPIKLPDKKTTGKKIILHIGRLAKTKNIDLLLEAFSLCKLDNAQLVIAGFDAGALKSLEERTKELGLNDRVVFKGRVYEDEKYRLLSDADVFVHPSLVEACPVSLIEALEIGTPCIGINTNVNNEIIKNGVNGILADATPESLSESITRILSDDDLARTISENAKNTIPQKFNWKNTVKSLEQTYQTTISKV